MREMGGGGGEATESLVHLRINIWIGIAEVAVLGSRPY